MAESAKHKKPLNRQLQLKSPADKVSDIFRNQCGLFPTIMPKDAKTVEENSADVWLWTFCQPECGSWKYTVEPTEDTKPVTWTLLDGEVPKKLYNSLNVDYKFSPNEQGCLASADLYFNKNNAMVPDPNNYCDFFAKMFEAVDKYLQRH